MAQFTAELGIATKVLIDGDKGMVGTITAVVFRQGSTSYEVSYIHNGQLYSPYVEAWRVTRAPY